MMPRPQIAHYWLLAALAGWGVALPARVSAQEFRLVRLPVLGAQEATIEIAPREDGAFATVTMTRRPTPAEAHGGMRPVRHEVVLAEPAHRLDVTALPDGRWIVLAGGVERGLDLYLFDPKTGDVGLPFRTESGLRMSESFGGAGSVPRAESEHFVAFAVEQGERCVVHVVDFSDQVPRAIATVEGSLETSDFAVDYDERSQAVTLRLIGDPERPEVQFPHPLAPNLDLDPKRVEFGRVQAGVMRREQVRFRNAGGRPLDLTLRLAGSSFRLASTPFLRLPGGGSDEEHVIEVEFAPISLGVQRGTLHVETPVLGASAEIALHGEAVLAVYQVPAARIMAPLDLRPGGGEPEAGEARQEVPPGDGVDAGSVDPDNPSPAVLPPEPLPLPRLLSPRADELRALQARRIDAGRVWVTGALRLDGVRFPKRLFEEGEVRLLVRNRGLGDALTATTSLEVALGSMDAEVDGVLPGRAGDALEVALIDGRGERTDFVDFAQIQPLLTRVDDTLVSRVAPNGHYLLMLVELDDAGAQPQRCLRSWRGRADGRGTGKIPFSQLDLPETGRLHFVVAESGTGAGAASLVTSDVLVLNRSR